MHFKPLNLIKIHPNSAGEREKERKKRLKFYYLSKDGSWICSMGILYMNIQISSLSRTESTVWALKRFFSGVFSHMDSNPRSIDCFIIAKGARKFITKYRYLFTIGLTLRYHRKNRVLILISCNRLSLSTEFSLKERQQVFKFQRWKKG